MTLGPDPDLQAARAALHPYLDRSLERAGSEALRLGADQVSLEHLLRVLLEDQDSALHRLVEHAFADAATLSADVLAIAPGLLVVGSDATLPFSPRSVLAMRRARGHAAGRGAPEVTVSDVLREAVGALDPALRAELEGAGLAPLAPGGADEPQPAAAGVVREEGHLFHHFSQGARRALALAGRVARRAGDGAVAPAHLVVAALEEDGDLARASGLGHRRAALLLRGRGADPDPPAPRALAPDPELVDFLARLPRGADSLEVLRRLLVEGAEERALIFTRQKVTLALLERARAALRDPDGVDDPEGTGYSLG